MGNFTATVLRYGNVYGPRQDPHGEAGVCAIFAPRMLQGQPVTIFGDGTQVRDYIYVGDVADANVAALTRGEGEAFNIGTGIGTSTEEVFTTLKAVTSYGQDAIHGSARLGDLQTIYLSPAKAETGLGWQPKTSFKEGTIQTVNWYKQV